MDKKQLRATDSLAELQLCMSALVMRRLTTGDLISDDPINGYSVAEIAASFIKPSKYLSSADRIGLYNRQYWWRLRDCLREDFPFLNRLIGDRSFTTLIDRYLERFPSRSYSLRDLGSKMVDFLKEEPTVLGRFTRLGREIAMVEWAQILAFDSIEYSPLDPTTLNQTAIEDVCLGVQPFVQLLKLSYELDDWMAEEPQTLDKDYYGKGGITHSSQQPRLVSLSRPRRKLIYLAIHRALDSVYLLRIDRSTYCVLKLLQGGTTLSSAIAQGISLLPRQHRDSQCVQDIVHSWFTDWSKRKWLCAPGVRDYSVIPW